MFLGFRCVASVFISRLLLVWAILNAVSFLLDSLIDSVIKFWQSNKFISYKVYFGRAIISIDIMLSHHCQSAQSGHVWNVLIQMLLIHV